MEEFIMNKKIISRITILAITGTIFTNTIAPNLTAYASEITPNEIISSSSNELNFITIDGITYNAKEIADSIRPDIDYNITSEEIGKERGLATIAIKSALNWLKKNWRVVYNKIPSSMKKYFAFDRIFAIADQFIGISDSVEDFFHRVFRAAGIPENVNWFVTNIIMLLLPI